MLGDSATCYKWIANRFLYAKSRPHPVRCRLPDMQLQQKDRGDDHGRYLSSAGGTGDTWTHRCITHTVKKKKSWQSINVIYIYYLIWKFIFFNQCGSVSADFFFVFKIIFIKFVDTVKTIKIIIKPLSLVVCDITVIQCIFLLPCPFIKVLITTMLSKYLLQTIRCSQKES